MSKAPEKPPIPEAGRNSSAAPERREGGPSAVGPKKSSPDRKAVPAEPLNSKKNLKAGPGFNSKSAPAAKSSTTAQASKAGPETAEYKKTTGMPAAGSEKFSSAKATAAQPADNLLAKKDQARKDQVKKNPPKKELPKESAGGQEAENTVEPQNLLDLSDLKDSPDRRDNPEDPQSKADKKDKKAKKAMKAGAVVKTEPVPKAGTADEAVVAAVKPWTHPQAWVPLELAFYLFLAPFFFWPLAVGALVLQIYSQDLQGVPVDSLKNYNLPTVTYIMAADNTPMAEIYNEHRLVLTLDQMPPVVIEAFLAAEDSSFYQHQGVDLFGIIRAALANFRARQTVQGASTITQQMIRTFLLTNERTYDRKLKEMILAWRAERILTKDEILYLYLNRIYLGRGAYGVESAARLYFNKTLRDVTLGEAAMLAGLAQAPGRLQAHLGTEQSIDRQRYVLNRMLTVGFITQEQARSALNTPLKFLARKPNLYRQVAPQFAEVVRLQMSDHLGADTVLNEGLRIYSTLDLKAQAQAEAAVRQGLDNLAKRQRMSPLVRRLTKREAIDYMRRARASLANRALLVNQEPAGLVTKIETGEEPGLWISIGDETGFLPAKSLDWILGRRKIGDVFQLNDLVMVRALGQDPRNGVWSLGPAPPPEIQGALVLMENKTGRVLAMVGGRDFGLDGIGNSDFNRAVLALRQPGSSFKPFVYTAALDHGYTEASVVYDVPISYPDGPGKIWRPKNYGGGHSGAMTIFDAIKRSVNVVAVKVCESIGPPTVAEYAHRMGITSQLSPTLSLALGASEVTLLDLTKAYTTFPNLGSWAWPTFISRVEDRWGRTIMDFKPYLTEAISPQTAYIMVDMLQAVASRGTAARVAGALKVPVGGKTGTTNSQADALFVGFTPEYTCGVWVGRETRVSLGGGEQGGRTAAPIFIDFMKEFLADRETGTFQMPPGVVRQRLGGGYDDMGEYTSASFVFKVGEVGRGREDTKLGDEYEAIEGPMDARAQAQDEIDRRLFDYLADY
ncbi:MAG: PBP1A family penicillin-binding protein [Deltaproteobacteria bacterium]|nr:PBP1A family penicillin-binding protein [Deltaproteobacteria bacterium]